MATWSLAEQPDEMINDEIVEGYLNLIRKSGVTVLTFSERVLAEITAGTLDPSSSEYTRFAMENETAPQNIQLSPWNVWFP